MIYENNKCYNFKKITYTNGLLDDAVDATYIIHLEGNGRYESILKQLELYQPTKIVYIVFNKGYKNCSKDENIVLPAHDLVDAFLTIFKHSNGRSQNYGNILILEDDFIFSEKIKDVSTQINVCTFLNNRKNQDFQYLLGCLPLMQFPSTSDCKHYRTVASIGTHACIYSKTNRTQLLEIEQTKITDWDLYNCFNTQRYTYYEPICYQLFPDTENSNNWHKDNNIFHVFAKLTKKVMEFFKLDIQVEPGYSFFYIFSKIVFFLLFFIFFFIIILFLTLFLRAKRKNKNKLQKK
jgi:hypothetical protein